MQNMKSRYPDTQRQEFTAKRPVTSYSVSGVLWYKKGFLIKLRNVWTEAGLKITMLKIRLRKERSCGMYFEYSINNIWIESVASEMCRRPGQGWGWGRTLEYNTFYASNRVCKISPHFILQNSGIPKSRDVPNGKSYPSFCPCFSHHQYG